MAESEIPPLNAKQKRAIRLLTEGPAHELQDKLLDVLSYLAHYGLVERRPYRESANGKIWNCYETRLTERGKNAAAAIRQDNPNET